MYVEEGRAGLETIREELEMILGERVTFTEVNPQKLETLLTERYERKERNDDRLQLQYYHGAPDDFLNDLIAEARSLKSSDIHIEIYEEACRVRIRVDGLLVTRYLIDGKQYPSLVNKVKIASNLDIAEKRLPQDGRIFFRHGQEKFDIRVSIIPTLHGEKIVLRLLNNDATNIQLQTLGFSEADLGNYMEGVRKTNGIVLISGPTGSGKTTTLYATLKLLNSPAKNILTIEDPIEYTLEGVNQVQVKDSIGLTFARAMRSFLRQDPNIIMLGEIRDVETANMAIRLALTGHLVLSTIHTNSAWGTVSRLVDMGVPSFLIADTLNTSIAQRLVRILCPVCKRREAFDGKGFPRRFQPPRPMTHHCVAVGCEECFNTGYKGRKAVYEVIPIDEVMAEAIKRSSAEVGSHLKEQGVKSLPENVFDLFEAGLTSLDEIYPLLLS
jgi:general secretion pathway protein E/type IV pilus assembly protein PilB